MRTGWRLSKPKPESLLRTLSLGVLGGSAVIFLGRGTAAGKNCGERVRLFIPMSTYLLVMHGITPCRLQVGALGEICLSPGCYLYVGSAKRNLEARLRRHLMREKRRRWHIDYLLADGGLAIEQIWVGAQIAECQLAGRLQALPAVAIPQPRLGASDCRCPAHFFHYAADRAALRRGLGFWSLVPFFPA